MNQTKDIEVVFRKNIILVDKKSKKELMKYCYIQNYEEEEFIKQNIEFKEKSIEIIKDKIVYVDQLTESFPFTESSYIEDTKQNELIMLQKIFELFNKVIFHKENFIIG